VAESTSILVVDDDERISRVLERFLTLEGYSVTTARNGKEMRDRVGAATPDLIVLDLMLPHESGFELASELRRSSNIPIIMLSGRSDMVDKVVGLELGADDYITKPFEEREFLARVRNVLRRTRGNGAVAPATGECAHFAGMHLDLTAHELTTKSGDEIPLTSYEFLLLSALVTTSNRVLSRDQILDKIAGRGHSPYDRSVDVLVGKLRRKIESDPKKPKLVKTVRGAGYKFAARVEFH